MLSNKIFEFLSELKENNNKEWFDENRKRYEACRKEYIAFTTSLIEHIALFDPEITGTDAKKTLFRINRDIRFSKDKTPYKTNFGASISRFGKKSSYPGYYMHVEPDNCFIAMGAYHPEADKLATIRQEIDYNGKELKAILSNKTFKKTLGDIQGESLKTSPKGYDIENEHIDLLRMKSFYVWTQFPSTELTQKDAAAKVAEMFKVGLPFNRFIQRAYHETE